MSSVNNFVITVATANGSGSQSSNNVLVRTLFRMGLPVGGKNLFPSNIQGLPTWFTIRVNEKGFTARKRLADMVVAMNPATASEDMKLVHPGGYVLLSADAKLPESQWRPDVHVISIPFKKIVDNVTDSVKLKKLLVNMAYVGVLAELLGIPESALDATIEHQFGDKSSVIETNKKAIAAGRAYAAEHLKDVDLPWEVAERAGQNDGKILIDGNTASAMGMVFGGCTVVAWYPITPSSSVVESFIDMASEYRIDADGKKNFAVVQAEDELASIAMVLGAGWAGARAMTATSGPGLSLMAEAAGLSYYAEIPAVIWDVQRVGPSTGLPTRTMQGDLHAAYYLSHGDTKHVVLLPGTPEECFEYGQVAFDLAERLQTLVIVLSDLDIGMNLHGATKFAYPEKPFARGKVLSAEQLAAAGRFQRYKDVDGDGVPYRTLPGTAHPTAAYFTRGTGHDEAGLYSENPETYKANVDRLSRKLDTARLLVPRPVADVQPDNKVGIVTFGSSHEATSEARFLLQRNSICTNYMRLRALPLTLEFEEFLASHDRIYIVEQNRDAQLMSIVRSEMPQYSSKCVSVLHYDGMPLDPDFVYEQIHAAEMVST
ncbi:MAG: 2-oxoacid:acceptor oxidoreductase subunit alpha [Bdellovibrionales bacterium]|nr:2-oxoacid:acceptor oxidoreductase subunit alpha [Bdellovibrionales bacterium]